jgi:hypothetical protein
MAAPAGAAMHDPIGVWQLNESAGARVMVDSSGNRRHGSIGSEIRVGGGMYRFPWRRPNTPPANPQHLAQVPHSNALNPGAGDYAVELRMRTTHSFGNVVQKGQAGSKGGYFKFEQPGGKIACLFRGSGGQSTASSSSVRVNDGRWHTVRCERTPAMVVMTVDGVVTSRNHNPTGTIANTRPLTIAGKLTCDQVEITCDYFAGDIDYVKIETS